MPEKHPELRVASVSHLEMEANTTTIPLYLCPVSAGFPSPASDYVESNIDLNDWLISNKLATYIVRVEKTTKAHRRAPVLRLPGRRGFARDEPRGAWPLHAGQVLRCQA
jgi:hypothetical protein